jgi:hypothetical protein
VANFSTSFPSVVDTGGKFATGVNNTVLPPVSTTPAANLPPWEQHQAAETFGPIVILRGLAETDS